jgi:hypothetical protein
MNIPLYRRVIGVFGRWVLYLMFYLEIAWLFGWDLSEIWAMSVSVIVFSLGFSIYDELKGAENASL